MKNKLKFSGIITLAALIGFIIIASGITVAVDLKTLQNGTKDIAKQRIVEKNTGEWKSRSATLKNTGEAEFMIRVGDIDALNDPNVKESGYDPFTAESPHPHGYPWDLDPSDPPGTDRIYVGSKWKGGAQDGYASNFVEYKQGGNQGKAFGEGALTITMDYNLSGISVKNALLQICLDDFQAPVWNSNFTVTLNGKNASFIAELINQVSQTGPTCHIASFVIPSNFFADVASGKLVITIDETTGCGDGYAVDFVRLLVNYKESVFSGSFSGKTEPGATVRLVGTSTTVIAASDGSFSMKAIPGLNVVHASKAGYKGSYNSGVVLSSGTQWEPNIPLSR